MGSPATIAHGPSLLGVVFNLVLFGIMLLQCFMYFSRFAHDKTWVKLLVLLLLAGDTVHTVFIVFWIYDIVILHFNDLNALNTANWVFATEPAMTGIVATIVQLFFAWRIHKLMKNPFITVFVVLTALTSIVGGIGTAISIHFTPNFVDFQDFKVVVIVWLIGASVCDLTITTVLTWHLRRHRTGFSKTDDMLNKIIRVTVSNGLITSIWATVDLIVFLANPTGLHLLFNIPLSKLYTNSLMATLNSRINPNVFFDTSENSVIKKNGQTGLGAVRRQVELPQTTSAGVFVHVETHEMGDMGELGKADIDWPQENPDHLTMVGQSQKGGSSDTSV
ncbi:hypothetical protein BDW22DRAFT_1433528 [Trametopsis cervina]|nr:hypothetical protein BDW22DRAFT_1433528 [Trametopsis cervina]